MYINYLLIHFQDWIKQMCKTKLYTHNNTRCRSRSLSLSFSLSSSLLLLGPDVEAQWAVVRLYYSNFISFKNFTAGIRYELILLNDLVLYLFVLTRSYVHIILS
jgi:hypothetical protein